MADFDFLDGLTDGGGGGKKANKKKILIIGGGLAALAGAFVLLRNRSTTSAGASVYYPYSTAAADEGTESGAFINQTDFQQLYSDLSSQIDEMATYYDEEITNAYTEAENNYSSIIKAQEEHIEQAETKYTNLQESIAEMDYEHEQELYKQSQLNRMILNSSLYASADNAGKQALKGNNQIIGKELGFIYEDNTGTWWKQSESGNLERAFYSAGEEAGTRERITTYPGEVLVVENKTS